MAAIGSHIHFMLSHDRTHPIEVRAWQFADVEGGNTFLGIDNGRSYVHFSGTREEILALVGQINAAVAYIPQRETRDPGC